MNPGILTSNPTPLSLYPANHSCSIRWLPLQQASGHQSLKLNPAHHPLSTNFYWDTTTPIRLVTVRLLSCHNPRAEHLCLGHMTCRAQIFTLRPSAEKVHPPWFPGNGSQCCVQMRFCWTVTLSQGLGLKHQYFSKNSPDDFNMQSRLKTNIPWC